MSHESTITISEPGSRRDEKRAEREMIEGVKKTLDASKEVPAWEDPVTGIDIRNFPPEFGKDNVVVKPAEGDETEKLYLRHQKTDGLRSGHSVRAYVNKDRTGNREGQHVNVTTDYESKGDERFPKGSRTTVTVYDDDNNVIREREHQSDGVGLSPLVAKIVANGVDAQVKKIKNGGKE